MAQKNAIILLSGGLDSATCLAIALRDGFAVHTLAFDYGQRHRVELAASLRIAQKYAAVTHSVASIDMSVFGGSALTDASLAVPKDRSEADLKGGIPITYVPARNTVFLSYALARAEVLGADDIFIGVNALDYSGYPDCRREYIDAFERMANLATQSSTEGGRKMHIHSPLIAMTKAEIITLGTSLGVDYSLTVSCYDPDAAGHACGRCDSCALRRRGFTDAGVTDPTVYTNIAKAML